MWRLDLLSNRLVLWAIAAELVLLALFLGWTPLADLLGGAWPGATGWSYAAATACAVILADGANKILRGRLSTRAHHTLRATG